MPERTTGAGFAERAELERREAHARWRSHASTCARIPAIDTRPRAREAPSSGSSGAGREAHQRRADRDVASGHAATSRTHSRSRSTSRKCEIGGQSCAATAERSTVRSQSFDADRQRVARARVHRLDRRGGHQVVDPRKREREQHGSR
jgi:hypothetical protein